jgi:hypothetical protein
MVWCLKHESRTELGLNQVVGRGWLLWIRTLPLCCSSSKLLEGDGCFGLWPGKVAGRGWPLRIRTWPFFVIMCNPAKHKVAMSIVYPKWMKCVRFDGIVQFWCSIYMLPFHLQLREFDLQYTVIWHNGRRGGGRPRERCTGGRRDSVLVQTVLLCWCWLCANSVSGFWTVLRNKCTPWTKGCNGHFASYVMILCMKINKM